MNLVFKILSVVLVVTTLTFAQRNPPPCFGRVGEWVNDFGGCSNYFYCQSEENARVLNCPQGLGFDEMNQVCSGQFAMPPDCEFCPYDKEGFAVADDETTCTDYVLCIRGNREANVIHCGPGTRFDRAWGEINNLMMVLV